MTDNDALYFTTLYDVYIESKNRQGGSQDSRLLISPEIKARPRRSHQEFDIDSTSSANSSSYSNFTTADVSSTDEIVSPVTSQSTTDVEVKGKKPRSK